jgi:hypothetical protein
VGEGYEFTAAQNGVLESLARSMRFVGVTGFAMGVVLGGAAVFSYAKGYPPVLLAWVVLAVAHGVIAGSMVSASKSLMAIVTTSGNDIPNLMLAFGALTRAYAIQRVLILVSAGVIAAVIFWGRW